MKTWWYLLQDLDSSASIVNLSCQFQNWVQSFWKVNTLKPKVVSINNILLIGVWRDAEGNWSQPCVNSVFLTRLRHLWHITHVSTHQAMYLAGDSVVRSRNFMHTSCRFEAPVFHMTWRCMYHCCRRLFSTLLHSCIKVSCLLALTGWVNNSHHTTEWCSILNVP